MQLNAEEDKQDNNKVVWIKVQNIKALIQDLFWSFLNPIQEKLNTSLQVELGNIRNFGIDPKPIKYKARYITRDSDADTCLVYWIILWLIIPL